MAHILVDRFGPAMWHAVIERMGQTSEAEDAFVDLMLAVWKRIGRQSDVARLREHVARALASLGVPSSTEVDSSEGTADMLFTSEDGEALEETGLPEEVLPNLPAGIRNRALQRLRAEIAFEEAEARRLGSWMARAAYGLLAILGLALVGYGWWGERTSNSSQTANDRHTSLEPISSADLPVQVEAVFDITRQPVDLGHLAFGGGELVTGSLSLGPQGDGIQLSAYALRGLGFLDHPRWTSNVPISPPAAEPGASWLLRSWILSSAGDWAVVTVNWTENGIHGAASEADVYAVPMTGGRPSRLAEFGGNGVGEIVVATGTDGIAWQMVSEKGGMSTVSPIELAPIASHAGAVSLGPSVRMDVSGLVRNAHVTNAGLVCQGTTAHAAPAGAWICIAPTGQETTYAGVSDAEDGDVVEGKSGVLYEVASASSSQGQTLVMTALHAPGNRQPTFRLETPVSAWGADGGYVDYVETSGGRTYLVVARAD
ncbi:hypothetical protein IW967_13090 [Alicyclobacillus mali]|uniref:DNA-directed RNA polymerase specialized sigma subunit, sigma24 family n=2 Tax=Alicyclobacillus mali (ex Roth et al. 2021) TaxID=1123961 RepID=A0ABS0F670_9BACL|nr:hypothetical protein [Alicyclobacillus mali (ex Roth et al. 2021)]MCL6487804.1 hypothetical protein [Alicyclobacillus mali (ex Roth et al. 2021)]